MEKQEIELYIHGEGLKDSQIITIDSDKKIVEVIKVFFEITSPTDSNIDEYEIYLEDEEFLMPKDKSIKECITKHRSHIHCHRCKIIELSITYNGSLIKKLFTPQTTFQKVLDWALKEFKISDIDGSKLILRLGTSDGEQILTDQHIGSFIKHPNCSLILYLTPELLIQG